MFAGPKPRRTSVSAESMDPTKVAAMKEKLAVIEKPPEIAERLLGVIGKSALLRMLDNEQKDSLVKAFAGPKIKPAGEDIIVQGEIGETFYLLEDGSVDVYISKGGGLIVYESSDLPLASNRIQSIHEISTAFQTRNHDLIWKHAPHDRQLKVAERM